MYKLKIKKEMTKFDEQFQFEDELIEKVVDLEINETDDCVSVNVLEQTDPEIELSLVEELELIFQNIEFNKETYEITNIQEITSKWQKIKKENIFKRQDKKTITTILELSKYCDNQNVLSDMIKNFSFIPFILFFYRHKKMELKEEILTISNIFINDEIEFKMKLEKGKEENEYIIVSEVAPLFGITDYRASLRKYLNVPASKVFSPKVELSGKYVYSDHLESMSVEIIITSREDMNYTKTIEIWEE